MIKIISGGQTGVDRAALDAAIELELEHGGWCPRGRRSEDGTISTKYNLIETLESDYITRTKKNIETSDATLIFRSNQQSPGTKLTIDLVEKSGKPFKIIFIDTIKTPEHEESEKQLFLLWIFAHPNLKVLNVAGPRESKNPGVYTKSKRLLKDWLTEYVRRSNKNNETSSGV